MFRVRATWALALLALSASPAAAAAAGACQFAKVGELPVTMVGTEPLVSAKINGKDALFLIDTGGFYSVLADSAIDTYGLKTTKAPSTFGIVGVSGVVSTAKIAKVTEFTYAGIPIKDIGFLVTPDRYGPGVAGTIGQNLLGAVDVEYDLANGVIRLWQGKDCAGSNLAYWSAGKPFSVLPTEPQSPMRPHIVVDAKINGYDVKAVMDTGAGTSILQRAAARRAGVDMSAANLKSAGYASGYGGAIEEWIGSVGSIAIGGEEIRNTKLRMGNVDLPGGEMLLGADFFLSHRVMVARSQRQIFFTYNGGPVFRLDQPTKLAPEKSEVAPAEASKQAATADELARRGAAFAARNDLKAGLADISKAIEMEPANADFRLARARIHAKAEAKAEALKDMDEAVRLKPQDQTMLMARADLRLDLKDLKGGEEDFLNALKQTPQDQALVLRVALRLANAHATQGALRILDSWIAANPKDDLLPSALDDRCWTRALAGTELDQALRDCDEAVRKGRRSAVDSRGLVYLRMGRYNDAIGQYNQVIFQAPREAWALYGRGVAKARMGQAAAAKLDLDAALAADKEAVDMARSFGITPDGAPAPSKTSGA